MPDASKFPTDDAPPVCNPADIAEHKIHISMFKNRHAATLETKELALAELAELIGSTVASLKKRLPLLKGARFGNQRTEPGSLRHNGNVLRVTLVELDYDDERISFADAVARLGASGLRALIYTSPSHTPDGPRWRILLPCSTELPPEAREGLAHRAALKLGMDFGGESFTLSQAFYFGRAKKIEKPEGVFIDGAPVEIQILDGEFVDLADLPEWAGRPDRSADERDNSFRNGPPADPDEVEHALGAIVDDSYGTWIKIAAALWDEFGDDGFELFDKWSAKSPKYRARETKEKWRDCQQMTQYGIGTVYHLANSANPGWRSLAKPDEGSDIQGKTIETVTLASATSAKKLSPVWRDQFKSGEAKKTLHNGRAALSALGIQCRYDTFRSRLFIACQDGVTHEIQELAGEASDDTVIALRRIISDLFAADFSSELVFDAVRSIAMEHRYDPVRDMLDEAEAAWDGQPRLDRMVVDYANAADTLLNRAFMRTTMIAAVRRARHPGCKFDQICVLESPEGWNKSSFWRVLAGDEFYSDESIIGKQSREVQEQLASVWIHENAELAGMKKAEIETVKAYCSRQEDVARPVYARTIKRQPRHSIDVGTTNNDVYLQSQTGNRRFWPIKVLSPIDLEKLRRDRLQLLGEAVARESRGETITLDPSLWGAAAVEQEARRVTDAWEDILATMPTHVFEDQVGRAEHAHIPQDQSAPTGAIKIIHREDGFEKVVSATIIRHVLQVRDDRADRNVSMRLSVVMQRLGWDRPGSNKITIDGQQVRGYQRPIPTSDGAAG